MVLQVVRLLVDFVFFRVNTDGHIVHADEALPGFMMARAQVKKRLALYEAGQVPQSKEKAKKQKFQSWVQQKGSHAWKAKQNKLPSVDYGRPAPSGEREDDTALSEQSATNTEQLVPPKS